MVDIRPNQLPDAILPLRDTDELVVDQGADGVRKAPPSEAVNSVAPVASQGEALAGADNTKRMTPLRTKQSIASEVGVSIASKAQGDKADSSVQSVNGKTGNSVTLVKADVGLGNVDNTSDVNKPISTATQSALDLKANSSVTISAGSGLTGGGNLTANRTVSLNAASIASLAKAESSVQTVNGVFPTSGNVNVTVGVPEDGSVTDIKVYSPPSPGDAVNSSKVKLDLSSDNPNMVVRLVSDKFKDVISARDFGAFGAGNDYTTELQAFFDDVKFVGKRAWVPSGEYALSQALLLNNNVGGASSKNEIIKKTDIIGDGAGSTIFRVVGDHSGITIASGMGKSHHRGFSIVQDSASSKIGTGITVMGTAGIAFSDIEAKGFSLGFDIQDSFSIKFSDVDFVENAMGLYGHRVITGDGGSHPNALNFISCKWIENNEGALLVRPTTCNFIGGSFESNGPTGDPDAIAVNIRGNSAEGAFGCNFMGVYFENNAGFTDIALTNQTSGVAVGMHRIHGCTFNRISNTRFTDHNLYISKATSGFMRVVASENSFQGFNTYVPDISRKYILSVDGGAGSTADLVDQNNVYGSTIEAP